MFYYISSIFHKKIDSILNHFKEDILKNYSSYEIFNVFSTNKRVLLYLIKEQIIQFDVRYLKIFRQSDQDCLYFLPEISSVSNSSVENDPELFQKNRENGENETQICEIIRKDSVEEFKKYVEQQNISLNDTKIKPTIFETNLFLMDKQPTLIEYSAFFGSIQIFQYLSQKVKLTSKLWIYAIHGNNKEIIHLLEQNHVKPGFLKSKELLIESIKCHHNDMTKYVHKNFYKKKIKPSMIIPYYNYEYIDIESTQKNMNEFISNDYVELFSNVFKCTDKFKKNKNQWKTLLIVIIVLLLLSSIFLMPIYLVLFLGLLCVVMIPLLMFIKKQSLFSIAVCNSNTEIVNIMMSDPHVDVNEIIKINKEKKTLLFIAIEKEDIDIINILLSSPNIDINKGISLSASELVLILSIPLIIILSIIFPIISPLSILLIFWIIFATISNRNRKKTPIELAIETGNIEIIKILLSHPETKINLSLKTPIILSALNARNAEVIQIIYKNDEHICAQNDHSKILSVIAKMIIFVIIAIVMGKIIIFVLPRFFNIYIMLKNIKIKKSRLFYR